MSSDIAKREIAKLETKVVRLVREDHRGRVADAAMHLRQAMDLISEVDTTPSVHEAAVAMDRAATVLLRYLDTRAGENER